VSFFSERERCDSGEGRKKIIESKEGNLRDSKFKLKE